MHPDDIAERGLHPLDAVDLVGFWEVGLERKAEYFHVVAYRSRTPTSKFIVIEVRAR